MRIANFKLAIDGLSELLVLRVYEHDASLCQKEVDLLDPVRASVPVPPIVHAEPMRRRMTLLAKVRNRTSPAARVDYCSLGRVK